MQQGIAQPNFRLAIAAAVIGGGAAYALQDWRYKRA
jgi:hypothetical protein